MALVIRTVIQHYDILFNEKSDPRTEELPLVGSPLPMAVIITLYLFFVNKWGPKLMANRKAFDLQNVMIVFNLVQILGNLYIMVFGFRYSYGQKDFSIRCQSLNYDVTEAKMKLVYITYMYYILKLVDLLDTVFFVLRKKTNQITFLHIYHHSGMVFGTYISCKFLAGSHATMLGLINSWVHVVMYTYYFLTAFKPELKQSFWWKKHITQIQLIQFFILIFHFGLPLFYNDCDIPKFILFCGLIQNIFMFVLFSDFYNKAYRKKRTPQQSAPPPPVTGDSTVKEE